MEQFSLTLTQVCKAGVARVRRIWLTRHGESEWNLQAKLGGNSNLSARGKLYARLLPDILIDRVPLVCVYVRWCEVCVWEGGGIQEEWYGVLEYTGGVLQCHTHMHTHAHIHTQKHTHIHM